MMHCYFSILVIHYFFKLWLGLGGKQLDFLRTVCNHMKIGIMESNLS